MSKQKDRRLSIPAIGVYYSDLLKWDAAINDRSIPQQAQSLLCSSLQKRTELIMERLQYIANKENITVEELQKQILSGEWQKAQED